MNRVIFHVDMDAFYASVHALEDPRLAHVPLVVGADPRGGRGRGVASTANYHARRYGIHSAMPISKAYELCPHATFIAPNFKLYKPASQEVMAVLERYADVLQVVGLDEARQGARAVSGAGKVDAQQRKALQVVGLDEAYLDMTTASGGDFSKATALARSLQAAVKRATGLSCSVGVAHNKSIAKIASDYRKPHGVTTIKPEDAKHFLAPLPVKLINGCGPKTAAKLQEWGVETIGDLVDAEPRLLEERFGSHGVWLQSIANGEDAREVTAQRGPSKSRGNERTYLRDETDPAKIYASAKKVVVGLLNTGDKRAFSTITVKMRYGDFTTLTRSHTLSIPLDGVPDNVDLAWATAQSMIEPLLDGRAVRLVGVRLSGFQDATGQQTLQAYGAKTGILATVPS